MDWWGQGTTITPGRRVDARERGGCFRFALLLGDMLAASSQLTGRDSTTGLSFRCLLRTFTRWQADRPRIWKGEYHVLLPTRSVHECSLHRGRGGIADVRVRQRPL